MLYIIHMLVSAWMSLSVFAVDPKVTPHPDSQPVATGKEVTFMVKTAGSGLTFQWQKDGRDLRDDNRCRGTNADTLHIQQVKKDDDGNYRCLLQNKAERKLTGNAQLTVCKDDATQCDDYDINFLFSSPFQFILPESLSIQNIRQWKLAGQ